MVRDLNRLYAELGALHQLDFQSEGFEWIDCHDISQSVLSFLRKGEHGQTVLVVLNFTPVPRVKYRIGVPHPGFYRERLNTDSVFYGGSNLGNGAGVLAEGTEWMGRDHSLSLTLPPLAALVLEWQPD